VGQARTSANVSKPVGVSMSDGRAELDACGDEGSYVLPAR
jgi:hypothetical protein